MTLEQWLKGGAVVTDIKVATGLRNFLKDSDNVNDYWYDDKDMWAIDVLEDGTCITSCYSE